MFELVPILVAIGFGAGTLGSLIGVGGGIVIVPALTFLGLQPTQIASTSLFAVASTSSSSSLEYARQKRIDYRLAISMACAAIPGAVLGAFLSPYFTLELFKLLFAMLLASIGIYVIYKRTILRETEFRNGLAAKSVVLASSFGAGIISSLFGVGGGVIFVPVMLLVLGIVMQRAAPTSQLILMMTSVAGVITHSALGHPDYLYAVCLSIGALAGGYFGAKISPKLQDSKLQSILGLVLFGVSAKLLYDWMSGLKT